MRAERVADYDTDFLLNLVVQDDKCPGRAPWRGGWGVEQDSWGPAADIDVDGLLGSVLDRGGYAFAMDTFAMVAALLPVARYNASYAAAIGKLAANAANAARLFFPFALPPDKQSDWAWVAANEGASALSYEGLRKWGFNVTTPQRNNLTGPYGTGDAKWGGAPTNLALYGGAYVGLFGACVQPTDVPTVLAFALSPTDFWARPSYPSTLIFNPDAAAVSVALPFFAGAAGASAFDIYDAVAQAFAARACGGAAAACRVNIAAKAAGVFVPIPAGAAITFDAKNAWLLADGVVIDFAASGLPPADDE